MKQVVLNIEELAREEVFDVCILSKNGVVKIFG
jgi:hypothetical protein